MLVDKDPTDFGPFDVCTKTDKCYKLSLQMLWVFHGLVMKIQKRIYDGQSPDTLLAKIYLDENTIF